MHDIQKDAETIAIKITQLFLTTFTPKATKNKTDTTKNTATKTKTTNTGYFF